MGNTSTEFENVITQCRTLFANKLKDYGPSWRILRPSSLTDQIYIKANRIRSIQTKGNQKIEDDIISEFVAMVNYSIIALIQLELKNDNRLDLNSEECLALYDKYAKAAQTLMEDKNHDYDEAWRNLRVSSMVDLILMKILRLKQIEDNNGKTLVSEGADANYNDILNYSVFSLIQLGY